MRQAGALSSISKGNAWVKFVVSMGVVYLIFIIYHVGKQNTYVRSAGILLFKS